jgi:hypothetical protein
MKTPEYAVIIVDKCNWTLFEGIAVDDTNFRAIGKEGCCWLLNLKTGLNGLARILQQAETEKARVRIAYLAADELSEVSGPHATQVH